MQVSFEYETACRDMQKAYDMARSQEFAVVAPIARVWQDAQRALQSVWKSGGIAFPSGRDMKERESRALAIVSGAIEQFRAIMAVPREDRAEAWARMNGKPSPKALLAGALANMQEQHRRDMAARDAASAIADPKWSVDTYVRGLMKRNVVVHVDDATGRVWVRGPATEDDMIMLRTAHSRILAELRTQAVEVRAPLV